MLWENLKYQDFPEAVRASKGVCVIPLGASEKHGLHLPVGTDTFVVDEIARRAAELEPVVVFPAFGFGQLLGLQHMAGSVCLSTRLLMDFFTEICREIARSGFKKILILNGHGGNNAFVDYFCQSTREEKKDYVVMTGKAWPLSPKKILQIIEARGRDAFPALTDADIHVLQSYISRPQEFGHACFAETLTTLAVRPETVALDMMDQEDGRSTHRFDHLEEAGLYSPYVWMGNQPNSHQATYHPGANERLAAVSLQLVVEQAAHLFKVYKDDQEMLRINEEWNQSW